MPVLLGDRPCLEPGHLYRECMRVGLSTGWFGLANAYQCALGAMPGEGWVLLARTDLDLLATDGELASLHDLTFKANIQGGEVNQAVIKNLVIVGADCITPGARAAESAYLIRLADRRHFLRYVPIDARFNMRHALTGAYLPETINSGSPWSWEEMLSALWATTGKLGDWPGLPEAPPAGYPEDWEFDQAPADQVWQQLLARLGWSLAWNPLTDAFTLIAAGGDDAAATAALAAREADRHHDAYPRRSVRGVIPEKVRVLFRKLPHVRGEGSPFYTVDVEGDTEGTEPDTFATIPDDLEALYDAWGNLTNETALEDRAEERATEYYRSLLSNTDRLRIVYPYALSDAALMPGPQIQSVRWAETGATTIPGRGLITEISRHGVTPRPAMPDITIDPLTQVVRLTGVEEGGLLDAFVQDYDEATRRFIDRGRVWVVDANG